MMMKVCLVAAFLLVMGAPSLLHFGLKMTGAKLKYTLIADLACFAVLCIAATVLVLNGGTALADGETAAAADGAGMAYLAAALSTGLACIGAGIAVSSSAAAAIGAISEDSSVMGKSLIFVALAEGIALYGLLISFTIIGNL